MNIKKIGGLFLAVILVMLSVQSCNTMRGMGEDIEKGGEVIQDAAE